MSARPLSVAAVLVVLLTIAVIAAVPAAAQEAPAARWQPHVDAARAYAEGRAGRVAFAAIDERGRLAGEAVMRPAGMASLLKPVLMLAHLRGPAVRDRALGLDERRLLSRMIRRSDNAPATRLLDDLGPAVVERTARLAGMTRFRVRRPWGLSEASAADHARFMHRLDGLLPARHRTYARTLLRTVVARQRWGVARAAPRGWRLHFKGGWGSGTGRFCHQAAFLERGERRISLAILIEHSPSHAYGTETLRGVAARLLAGL